MNSRWWTYIWRIVRGRWFPTPPAPDPVETGDDLIDELNRYRAKYGLRELATNNCLASQATIHAQWMDANRRLNHDGFSARLKKCAVLTGAENVASGYRTESEVIAGWDSSRGHRDNMRGDWSSAGGGESGGYWCLIFAR